jgi:hypothetical protein
MITDLCGVFGIVQGIMGFLALFLHESQRSFQGVTGIASHDLSAEDPLHIIALRKIRNIEAMKDHVVDQHRHIIHAPGHERIFIPTPINKFPVCFREGNALLSQQFVADAGKQDDFVVHSGVVLRRDVKSELLCLTEIFIELYRANFHDLTMQVDGILYHGSLVCRPIPFQIKNDVIHWAPFFLCGDVVFGGWRRFTKSIHFLSFNLP